MTRMSRDPTCSAQASVAGALLLASANRAESALNSNAITGEMMSGYANDLQTRVVPARGCSYGG